jgi:hypothetical protein
MEFMKFEVDNMYGALLEDFSSYKNIHSYVSDEKAMKEHIDSLSCASPEPVRNLVESEERMKNLLESSIKDSLDHFAALTITGICSTFEITAKQFFKILFLNYPNQMHQYLGNENQKGMLNLSDVLDSDSYDNLLITLSEKASKSASKGKYGEILTRAYKLSKYEINLDVIYSINELQKERNKIVHEKSNSTKSLSDISYAHKCAATAIEELARCAEKRGLPGNYTCINPIKINATEISVLMKNS